jgi:hypothetical protein
MQRNTDTVAEWRKSGAQLYSLADDWREERNLAGGEPEKEYAAKMKAALQKARAPEEQFARLGL